MSDVCFEGTQLLPKCHVRDPWVMCTQSVTPKYWPPVKMTPEGLVIE